MPFFKLTEIELREYSKRYLESLEFWLRRVIDNKLTESYGSKYWEHRNTSEEFIIKKEIRNKVSDRLNKHPDRFSRWIDASLLEHQIDIICKQQLFDNHFKAFLDHNFPLGKEQIRHTLKCLSETRNRLYHSNPISVRQAEQAVCYSRDIIESIQKHYIVLNTHKKFNVPLIMSYSDSLGNKLLREQLKWATNTLIFDNRKNILFAGDVFKMEIEVDPSFREEEYSIIWNWRGISSQLDKNKKSIEMKITDEQVGEFFSVNVKIVSDKKWHRINNYDDSLSIQLTILPSK